MADRLALAKVRALFGARLQMALVGAAPIDRELLEFFDACGVTVLEGYGMTESCAAATLNPAEAPRFGTVGKALPDSEVKVTAEGEILMRGPHVFAGYHRDPEATRAALIDGWLHSGDLGELSSDGYLTVTGRKKDLIITSSGKNSHPLNIENALRETRWISEAVVYGDRKPYIVCMVTLDPDEAPKLAEQLGVSADGASMAAGRARARGDPGGHRRRQRAFRAHRADQALCDPRPRPHPGGRRADTDAEGEAGVCVRALRRAVQGLYEEEPQ